ncbi:MAG: hypothetical protein Tsb0016_09300 [Sphingomonadales bacterium]
MRIEGPKNTQNTSLRKAGAANKGDGAAFASALDAGGAARPAATAGAGPLAAVDAIMSLQAVDDSTQGRSKGLAQANDLLDLLENVRRGLLAGTIPANKLNALLKTLAQKRAVAIDPKLTQLLDDIELRARVELAKLGL